MPQIIPITDLRDTTEISKLCHEKPESIYITKTGYDDMVIMSMETYESMMKTNQIDTAIAEAEREYENSGELIEAREGLVALRRKKKGNSQS